MGVEPCLVESLLLSLLLVWGCSLRVQIAQGSSIGALGSKHTVILYSGGQEVGRWTSTGKVTSGEHGTRFAFKDSESGKYIRVMGPVAVIQE